MKRSHLRRKSTTNSHPHECLSVRDAYRSANPRCELYALLKDHIAVDHWGVKVPLRLLSPDAPVEVNHIFSDGQRYDYVPNLISLSRDVHRLFHIRIDQGRCVCLIAKYLKGGDDWNPEELQRVIGRNPLAYLDVPLPWEPVEALRQRIVSEITRNAA